MITIKIITISGAAGSGKDTFANYLENYLETQGKNVLIVHFADSLKFVAKTFHNWNGEKDEQGRALLQHLGTEIYRENNKYYWVSQLDYHLKMYNRYIAQFGGRPYDYVIIPDARFSNEITYFKEHYVCVTSVKINRQGYQMGTLSHHSSETALNNFNFDIEINTGDTLEEAQKEAYKFGETILKGAC